MSKNKERINKVKEKFINMLKKNNHELKSEYVNTTTKVLIDYNCGHEPNWIIPNSYKKGTRCPKCNGNSPIQAKEELIKLIKKNNHKLLSEYKNARTKVLIDYNCGHKPHWIEANSYKRGRGCPKCSKNCSIQAKEELVKLIKENNHKLLSEYVNNKTKVLINYNCEHDPHWTLPNNYKKNTKCPKCDGWYVIQAKEEFMEILETNNHKLLSEYKNVTTKVLIDFNCEHDPHWMTPHNYKNGQGCPKCSRCCPIQAKEDFMNILKENNHKLLSEYVNTATKVLIDFNCEHGPHWMTPNNYKNGQRCPKCRK